MSTDIALQSICRQCYFNTTRLTCFPIPSPPQSPWLQSVPVRVRQAMRSTCFTRLETKFSCYVPTLSTRVWAHSKATQASILPFPGPRSLPWPGWPGLPSCPSGRPVGLPSVCYGVRVMIHEVWSVLQIRLYLHWPLASFFLPNPPFPGRNAESLTDY